MRYMIASVVCGGRGPEIPAVSAPCGLHEHPYQLVDNRDNSMSPCQAYQYMLDYPSELCPEPDVIIYIHDDVVIHDPEWLSRVLPPFMHNEVIAVGLGGALRLGHHDLYRKPYNIWNMARAGYMSNQTDAEVHGMRETGSHRVAVLDAFFMAVRTSFLRLVGGWPTTRLTHHCLDLWLACEAARWERQIGMVGVSCTHLGGRSSISTKYQEAKWLQGGTLASDHTTPHEWIYREYKDVLPIYVPLS